MDRIADAFVWPVRDPDWVKKMLIMGLTFLIPIVGTINAIGWMLASLDRLRAGEERLAPANLYHLRRGINLFAVNVVYVLGFLLLIAAVYVPAVLLLAHEGKVSANAALVSLALVLSLLTVSVASLGSLALTFATPSIVLATESGGIAGGLRVGDVLRRTRANLANTLIAGLMLVAASFVGSLGTVACGVGLLFTTAYALAMQAWIVRSFEIGSPAPKAA